MTIIIERDASGKIVRYEDEAARVAGRGGEGARAAPPAPAAPATRDEVLAEHERAIAGAREAARVKLRRLVAELASEVAAAEAPLAAARRAARDLCEQQQRDIRRRAAEQEKLMEQLRDVRLTELRAERQRVMDPLDQRAVALQMTHQLEVDSEVVRLEALRDSRLADLVRAAEEKRRAAREAEAAPPAAEVQGA